MFPHDASGPQPFEAAQLVIELICSEVFLATSPTNWRALASSLAALGRKFGQKPLTDEEAYEVVMADAKSLANSLSYETNAQFPRRSILLVPAMTPRTVDYAAFGQLNYLSAGITTVFCNAVLGKKGIGNSCFIGHDCWDRSDRPREQGMPSLSPYHGLLPGIFRPHDRHRGWLGENEQAMVIADVDPLHAVEGKPRPESLTAPLALVAHLPVVESWELTEPPLHTEGVTACMCSRFARRDPSGDGFQLGKLLDYFRSVAGDRRVTTASDRNPDVLAGLLHELARLAGHRNPDWLSLRAKAYVENHLQDPLPWPPPVALDWICVDLGAPGDFSRYPEIEVPPFRWAPGEDPPDST